MSTMRRCTAAVLGALLGAAALVGCLGGPPPETAAGPICGIGTSPSAHGSNEECLLLEEDEEEDALAGAEADDVLTDAVLAPRITRPLAPRALAFTDRP